MRAKEDETFCAKVRVQFGRWWFPKMDTPKWLVYNGDSLICGNSHLVVVIILW